MKRATPSGTSVLRHALTGPDVLQCMGHSACCGLGELGSGEQTLDMDDGTHSYGFDLPAS